MADKQLKALSLWPGPALMCVALGMLMVALILGILRKPAPPEEVRWLAPQASEVKTPQS